MREQKQTPNEAAGVDYMDDEYSEFNNEEYRMRNVRLRPSSGLTHADETKDGRQSNISRGGGADATGDEAEANNENLMMLDLNQQRMKVKMRLRDYNEKVKQKKLLEEKAAKNK